MANAASAYAEYKKEETGREQPVSPSNFHSPYAGEIAGLVERMNCRSGYESPYGGRIEGLLEKLGGYGAYESPYGDRLAGLLDRAERYGSYESPTRAREDGILAELDSRRYESPYADRMAALYGELENSRFAYDPETDPGYQAARRSYLREADRAASDVLARTGAATGGRASSYAVSAAVQAANRYRTALSDRQQQLFDAAYRRYLDEYSQKLDRYRLLADRENTDYGRWADDYDRLAARLALLREGDRVDYQRWADDFGRLTDTAALLRAEDDAAYGRWSDDYARLADTLTRFSAREDTDYSRWAEEYALLADRLRTLSGLYDSDYDKWYDERSDAYSRLVSAISSVGYDPTDEELALAGMTRTEADKWLAYYNSIGYYSGGRSYSGRGGRSSKASPDEGTGQQSSASAYYAYSPTQKNTPIATKPSNIVTKALPLVNKSGVYPATTAVKDPVTVSSKGLIQSTLNSGGVGDSYNTWLQSRLKPDNAAEKVQQKITRERM